MTNSMNVACGINQRRRGTRVVRGGGPMNRAVGARLYFLAPVPGASPGRRPRLWYELTPLASPGAFNGKCPNPRAQARYVFCVVATIPGQTCSKRRIAVLPFTQQF